MTQQKGKRGKRPLDEAERKISISAVIDRPIYNQLLDACKRQNRSISSIVGEAVENVIKGRSGASSGPTRAKAFGMILAAAGINRETYLDTLATIADSPEKILPYARRLTGFYQEFLNEIPAGAFDYPFTTPEAAELELEYLRARLEFSQIRAKEKLRAKVGTGEN